MAFGRAVCFGKIPTHGDFVRHNAYGSASRLFDAWCRDGLYQGRMQRGRTWPSEEEARTSIAFVACPTTDNSLLAGVFRWSRDAAGRRYPLVVGYEWEGRPSPPAGIAALPMSGRDAFRRAEVLVQRAVDGCLDPDPLADAVERDRSGWETLDGGGRRAAGTDWAKAVSVCEFATAVWGEFDDTRKYIVFKSLLDGLAPLRGRLPAGFRRGLRFPIGAARGAMRSIVARSWVDGALRVLNGPGTTPTFFWPVAQSSDPEVGAGSTARPKSARPKSERPSLLLFLRPPPPSAFSMLLPGRDDGETVFDLEQRGENDPVRCALSLPPRLGRRLESADDTLADVLSSLSGR